MHAEAQAFYEALRQARSVTIATHINPDADTIGTGLGMYALLKKHFDIPVEIVNTSEVLPHYLDFLPNFSKIKKKSDFDGLIIACDGADASRFGFDFGERFIVNIDHHASNTHFGHINVVRSDDASCAETAYEILKTKWPVDAQSALCFYTGLFSDTRHFTTDAVNADTFRRASELIACGADPVAVAYNLTQRKSLASIRLLERALRSLRLYLEATVAVMTLEPEDFIATGANMTDLDDIVDHGRSLATVDIAVLASALPGGDVRISLRSKKSDVSAVAARLGGGGHIRAAGVTVKNGKLQEIVDTILHIISETKRES
jgi:phosphoesterase RecJ-like protein